MPDEPEVGPFGSENPTQPQPPEPEAPVPTPAPAPTDSNGNPATPAYNQ